VRQPLQVIAAPLLGASHWRLDAKGEKVRGSVLVAPGVVFSDAQAALGLCRFVGPEQFAKIAPGFFKRDIGDQIDPSGQVIEAANRCVHCNRRHVSKLPLVASFCAGSGISRKPLC
jgi:hypothetical protein